VRHVGCKAAAETATQDEVTAAVEADPAEVPVPSNGNEQEEGAAANPNQGAARFQAVFSQTGGCEILGSE